jgi:hypothetical protein
MTGAGLLMVLRLEVARRESDLAQRRENAAFLKGPDSVADDFVVQCGDQAVAEAKEALALATELLDAADGISPHLPRRIGRHGRSISTPKSIAIDRIDQARIRARGWAG